MAEIMTSLPSKNCNKHRVQIPRVDLTPMVDLGFLLLTFFVFSSTIGTSHVLHTLYPDDRNIPEIQENVKQSGTLSLLLGNNGTVYYYNGLIDENCKNWQKTTTTAIRQQILYKKSITPKDDFVILIKPGNTSSYGNLVSILDEMKINTVDRYTIVNPTILEQKTMETRAVK